MDLTHALHCLGQTRNLHHQASFVNKILQSYVLFWNSYMEDFLTFIVGKTWLYA